MKQSLNYGKISWGRDNFDPEVPCRPAPIFNFRPLRVAGGFKTPSFTDRCALNLLKFKGSQQVSFQEAYKIWFFQDKMMMKELGEGRAFLKYVQKHDFDIQWKTTDFDIHAYFMQKSSPRHDPKDEMAEGLSFAIAPVEINRRKIKLYVKDEDMLSLLALPFGEEEDFIDLVEAYVEFRFEWERWKAPAPTFLDWIKTNGKRPLFSKGQLGFCRT